MVLPTGQLFPMLWCPRVKNGCGGGSRTHGGRAYETHLNLILPAIESGGIGG